MAEPSRPLAHDDPLSRQAHLLEDHLRAVGELAGAFAAVFGAGPWGELAGLWHDLGKYAKGFQQKIAAGNAFADLRRSPIASGPPAFCLPLPVDNPLYVVLA